MDAGNDTDREARKGKEREGEGGREGDRERTGRVWCQRIQEKMVTSCSTGPDTVSSEEKIWNKIVVIV